MLSLIEINILIVLPLASIASPSSLSVSVRLCLAQWVWNRNTNARISLHVGVKSQTQNFVLTVQKLYSRNNFIKQYFLYTIVPSLHVTVTTNKYLTGFHRNFEPLSVYFYIPFCDAFLSYLAVTLCCCNMSVSMQTAHLYVYICKLRVIMIVQSVCHKQPIIKEILQ